MIFVIPAKACLQQAGGNAYNKSPSIYLAGFFVYANHMPPLRGWELFPGISTNMTLLRSYCYIVIPPKACLQQAGGNPYNRSMSIY